MFTHHLPKLLCGLLLAGLALASAATPASAAATNTVREQEIAQCLPQEIVTWGDGSDRPAGTAVLRLALRNDDAPPWFSTTQVLEAVDRAALAWSRCGIGTQVQLLAPGEPVPQAAVLVSWSDARSAGNFGLANLRAHTLALGPAAFRLLHERNPAYPALDTLQMVLSHEMGHFFGLMAHSRRCVDVMSYYDDGKGGHCVTRDGHRPGGRIDYRALLPTACDIARCRAVNAGALLSRAP
jgi:hypothetical protein